MAESLLVDRNFVSGICKLKPNTNQKKIKSTTIIRIFFLNWKRKIENTKNGNLQKYKAIKNFKMEKKEKYET